MRQVFGPDQLLAEVLDAHFGLTRLRALEFFQVQRAMPMIR